jgi:siroheme synthase-like protein
MTSLPKNKQSKTTENGKPQGNPLFPVFLKLNQLHTVLIGAGNIGLEKLCAILLNCPEAQITVVALTISPEVAVLAAGYNRVTIVQKAFADTDLDDADLVIAATNNPELNDFIRSAARNRRLLVNIADKPELCDFYLGSIVQKGDLKIAISTNGKSPTVAKRLKEVLNEALPDELNITLTQVNQLRNTLTGDFASKVKILNELTSVLTGAPVAKNDSSQA